MTALSPDPGPDSPRRATDSPVPAAGPDQEQPLFSLQQPPGRGRGLLVQMLACAVAVTALAGLTQIGDGRLTIRQFLALVPLLVLGGCAIVLAQRVHWAPGVNGWAAFFDTRVEVHRPSRRRSGPSSTLRQ